MELDPDLSSPYAILGIMQVVDRRYEEAIASAKRAVALGPGDAEAQIALGYVQLFAGNHAEAAAAVETALRLDPNLSAIDREVAGLVFLLQGDNAKAIETLERTRDDAPAVGDFGLRSPRPMPAPAVCRMRKPRSPTASASLQGPSCSDSLAAWRITCAHFRNAAGSGAYHRRPAPGRPARMAVRLHRRRTRPVEGCGDRVPRHWPYTARPARTRPPTSHPADRERWQGGFPHDDADVHRDRLCRWRPLVRAEREHVRAPRLRSRLQTQRRCRRRLLLCQFKQGVSLHAWSSRAHRVVSDTDRVPNWPRPSASWHRPSAYRHLHARRNRPHCRRHRSGRACRR